MNKPEDKSEQSNKKTNSTPEQTTAVPLPRKNYTTIIIIVGTIAALLFLGLKIFSPKSEKAYGMYELMAHKMAAAVEADLEPQSNVIILARDDSVRVITPYAKKQVATLTDLLTTNGFIVADTIWMKEELTKDGYRPEGIPVKHFKDALAKNPTAAAIICLAGIPGVDEFSQLEGMPLLYCVSQQPGIAKEMIDQNLAQFIICGRPPQGLDPHHYTSPRTAQEWFDVNYQVLTPKQSTEIIEP